MKDPRQLWLVWGAILLTQPVFAGVAVLLGPPDGDPAVLVPVLGVALFQAVASLAFGRLVGPKVEPGASVVRWALAESVGLLGLVARFTAGPTLVAPALMLAGFVLILSQPPRTASAE